LTERGPYGLLARWILGRRRLVAGLLVLFTVVFAGIASTLEVDSDMLSMLPDDAPEITALRKLHHEEGGANLVTLAFASEDPEALDPFLDDLVDELQRLDGVQFAVHEVDPALTMKIGLLQLTPEDVQTLTGRLRGALALGSALNPIVTQRLLDMGPLTERIANSQNTSLLGTSDGKGKVLVRPTGSSHDAPFATRLMDDIDAVVAAADAEAHGVELQWVGGSYRHNAEDRAGIVADLQATTVVSALLVLTIIALAFRNPRATVLVMLPLAVGTAGELGVVALLFGSVNTYTSIGSAILLGLGIDFAVHLVGRYRELRALGRATNDAVEEAWDLVGPPCATAAMTSAAGFLALASADFKGFSQLGVALAIGLMMCLGAMLVGLPVLLPWLDRGSAHKTLLGIPIRRPDSSRSTYRLAPLGLSLAVVVTALAATRLPPDFEFDISNLRRSGMSYEELSDEERALAKDSYSPVVVTLPDAATLVREHARIQAGIEAGEWTHLGQIVSIENVLPHDQAARVAALSELRVLVDHKNLRYLPPPLVKNLLVMKDWDGAGLTRNEVPEALLTLLGARDESQHRLLVFPKGNMWDLREAAAFTDDVEDAIGEYPAAGEYTAMGALYRTILKDMPKVAMLAAFLVFALSALDLKRPLWIAGAVSTLAAGLVWAGVAVEGLGIRLSIVNIVGLPILLGIGVDVVIHLLHRLGEEGPGGVRRALSTTGVAALVSTLTTIASFVALTFAGNRGIQSLGLLVVIGLSSVFLVTALLLPLAWAAGWKISGQAPADNAP
jgi:predicted RND superfamily exporter protein